MDVDVDAVAVLAAFPVVVELEVSGTLRKAEEVEEVVVFVHCVKGLCDGRVDVRFPVLLRRIVGILECQILAYWAGGVEELCFAVCFIPIALRNCIVASRSVVRGGAVTVPSKFTGLLVPRIFDYHSGAFSWIADTPRAITYISG